jgi:hypothetical protein
MDSFKRITKRWGRKNERKKKAKAKGVVKDYCWHAE